jgi:hypothetical protein
MTVELPARLPDIFREQIEAIGRLPARNRFNRRTLSLD